MGLMDLMTGAASGVANAVATGAGALASGAKAVADNIDAAKQKRKPYQVNGDEARALKLLDEPMKVRQVQLEIFEPLWTKCILYAAGIQYITQLAGGRQWQVKKAQDWLPLPVTNIIQPKVQRAVDFFTRKRPTCYVEPARRTEEHITAAEIGDALIEDLWIRNGEDDKQDELATWLVTTGNAFKKTFIDTTIMSKLRVPQYEMTQEPILDGNGQPVIGMDGQPVLSPRYVMARGPDGAPVYNDVRQGVVSVEVVSPLAITVPLAATNLGRCPWIMETQIFPTHLLRQMFPEKADYIPDDGQVMTSDLYVHRITNLLSTSLHGGIRSVDPYYMRGFGIVNMLEVAPTNENPRGVYLIEMDGIPLYIGDLALENEFSYDHVGYYRVPSRFWCRGMVEDLLSPQDGLNKMEQYLQLNDAFAVNPQWVVPTQASIPKGTLSNRPGRIVEYSYPYKPERVPGEGLPPQIVERRQIYMNDAEEVSGLRSVIMGTAPTGITAGVALNRLGEEAEGMFDPLAKKFDRFIESSQGKKLRFVQKYYTVPQYMALEVEGGNVVELPSFQGADLKGNTTVRIEAGSYQPRSKAGLQQMLLDAFGQGLLPQVLTDPGQYDKFMEYLGISGFQTEQGLDFRRAKWENEMLSRPEGYDQVVWRVGDDDIVHLATHTQFRKTKQFLRLPTMIQLRYFKHEAEHLLHMVQSGGLKEPPQTDKDEKAGAAGDAGGEPAGGDGAPPDGEGGAPPPEGDGNGIS